MGDLTTMSRGSSEPWRTAEVKHLIGEGPDQGAKDEEQPSR
jgi:hypothetical protein